MHSHYSSRGSHMTAIKQITCHDHEKESHSDSRQNAYPQKCTLKILIHKFSIQGIELKIPEHMCNCRLMYFCHTSGNATSPQLLHLRVSISLAVCHLLPTIFFFASLIYKDTNEIDFIRCRYLCIYTASL